MSVTNLTGQRKSMGDQMRHYAAMTDLPQMLRLLLKAAVTMRRPVVLIWLDANDEECAAVGTVVEVLAYEVRMRTYTGTERSIALFDIWEADLLDEAEVA